MHIDFESGRMTNESRQNARPMTPDNVERTFAFVDISGFTAFTEAHGDDEAVAMLTRFRAITQAALEPGDALVKTIGDAVMLAFTDAMHAVLALRRLFDGALRRSEHASRSGWSA